MAIGSLGSTQYNKFVEFATGQMQSGNSKASLGSEPMDRSATAR